MATKTWSGGTSNWNDAANWTPAGVPVTGDDVIIDTAGATVTLDVHIGGGQTNTGLATLTIKEGTLYTNDGSNRMVTVTGKTYLGDNNAADSATLNCTGSDMYLGSGYNSDYGLVVVGGGTFTGGTGGHTIGSIYTQNNANAKVTLTSGTTNINSEYGSASKALNIGQLSVLAHGSGTILMNMSGSTDIKEDGGTLALNNLTINHASAIVNLKSNLTCAGNLIITAGEFNTDSSSDFALTATGYCDVTGTLTLNGSTVSVAALRCNSGAAVTQDSDGTLELATGSNFGGSEGSSYSLRNIDGTSDINLGGTTTVTGGAYFEPRTATVYASVLNNIIWNDNQYWVGEIRIGGTLVVNASKHLQPYGGSKNLTVVGDVTLNGGLSAYPNGHTDLNTMKFGSLTINSGGYYAATNGTTTITGENSSGFAIQNAGTFTHNKGLVDINLDTPTTTQASNGPYYNFTQSDAATDFYPAEAFEVMNDLYFVGDFEYQNDAHHLTVHGNMTIGNGSTTTRYMPYHTRTCNLTVGGILEVTTGATLTNFSHGTINVGGVRNTGGTM